jgi:ABC-type uncharacterized transport system ATPase subunit
VDALALIVDEPTAGLDPLIEQAFRESVGEARRRGQGIGPRAQRGDQEHLLAVAFE